MTAVDRVKKICKERKIPISRLESDLGFGNAYIKGLKKGVFPSDRIKPIADYLNVTVDFLTDGIDEKAEFATGQAELDLKISQDLELKSAIEKYYSLSEKKQKHVIELIELLAEEE